MNRGLGRKKERWISRMKDRLFRKKKRKKRKKGRKK